jgi:hypothetical protein
MRDRQKAKSDRGGEQAMSDTLRCRHCGEVIGVYEPLITLVEGRPWETSRLADPLAGALGGTCYHRACFEHRREEHEGAD